MESAAIVDNYSLRNEGGKRHYEHEAAKTGHAVHSSFIIVDYLLRSLTSKHLLVSNESIVPTSFGRRIPPICFNKNQPWASGPCSAAACEHQLKAITIIKHNHQLTNYQHTVEETAADKGCRATTLITQCYERSFIQLTLNLVFVYVKAEY